MSNELPVEVINPSHTPSKAIWIEIGNSNDPELEIMQGIKGIMEYYSKNSLQVGLDTKDRIAKWFHHKYSMEIK